jgi:hypothetical protein
MGLAALVASIPGVRALSCMRPIAPATDVAAACRSLACAAAIGSACRAALGDEGTTADNLTRLILDDLTAAGLDLRSISAIRSGLRELSCRDFAAARVISVDGWILSVTEIRAYALASSLA